MPPLPRRGHVVGRPQGAGRNHHGGVRAGALPLAHRGRLRRRLHHGGDRGRRLPGLEGLPQRPGRPPAPPPRQRQRHPHPGASDRGQLRGVGGALLHHRLRAGPAAGPGGSLEFHRLRSAHRRRAGRPQRPPGHGGLGRDGGATAGPDRGGGHPADPPQRPPLQQPEPLRRGPLPAAAQEPPRGGRAPVTPVTPVTPGTGGVPPPSVHPHPPPHFWGKSTI